MDIKVKKIYIFSFHFLSRCNPNNPNKGKKIPYSLLFSPSLLISKHTQDN